MAQIKRKKGLIRTFFGRLFCRRNIIIIADHKTDHIPVSTPLQLLSVLAVLGGVGWVSYSTGNYMAAQSVLKEKERTIVSTNLENRRIESEFALLKRDLLSLAEKDDDKLSDYAQFVIEQYKSDGGSPEEAKLAANNAIDAAKAAMLDSGAVLERIEFLEQKMLSMQDDHLALLDSIRDTTQGKISELEKIINTTGLNLSTLEKRASKEKDYEEVAKNRDNDDDAPRGGPYDPIESDPLLEQDSALFNNLQRMMLLNDMVNQLPLSKPMKDSKTTSGYGMRIDPFRKRLAFHSGLDFVSYAGAPVYATSDGVVSKVGARGAYGLAIEINHGLGVRTLYGHLSKIDVGEGQRIARGDKIGREGNTGRSTGAHLHYEIRYNGKTLNPKKFIEAANHVQTK